LRALRGLDKVYSREQIKIGLVYVAEGQEDERDIFCNETTNIPLYEEFVKGMATIVCFCLLSLHFFFVFFVD
jgi:hypothetical protein